MDFFVKAKLSTIEGFSTNEGVLCGENPFVKPSLSINEGFSTIEGFQCTSGLRKRAQFLIMKRTYILQTLQTKDYIVTCLHGKQQ